MFQEALVMAVFFFFRVSLQLLRENQDTHIRWELSLETSLSALYSGPFSCSFFAHPPSPVTLHWEEKKKRVFFFISFIIVTPQQRSTRTHTHTHLCFLGKMFMVSMLCGACLRLRYFDMLKCRNDEKEENVRLFRFSLDLNSLSLSLASFSPRNPSLPPFLLRVSVSLYCVSYCLFFLICFYTSTYVRFFRPQASMQPLGSKARLTERKKKDIETIRLVRPFLVGARVVRRKNG